MFPFWLFVGIVIILMGIFNNQLLHFLRLKPLSEVFTTPNIKQSSRRIEQIGRWLMITVGVSFLVQGLGKVLPDNIGSSLSTVLMGLTAVLLLAMFSVAIANWKTR